MKKMSHFLPVIYNQLHIARRKMRRARRFFVYGSRYISVRYLIQNARHTISRSLSSVNAVERKLIWIGPFPSGHRNVGDHAQTLAVEQFLAKHFSDYEIIRVDRNHKDAAAIDESMLERLSRRFTPDDLVLIHSSGDFGSKHFRPEGCWHETRKAIIRTFPQCRVIQLPTTVTYDDNEMGRRLLEEDIEFFRRPNVTILCRELVSLQTIEDKFECECQFFPDFVFYLQRPQRVSQRTGVLVILRADSESALTSEKKRELFVNLKNAFGNISETDILHSRFNVIDATKQKYIDYVLDEYEKYELVVTDRMHGMISGVVTNTPCIALNGGISHKISAYKSFLKDAVIFQDEIDFSTQSLLDCVRSPASPPDLSPYFDTFRDKIVNRMPIDSSEHHHLLLE